MNHDCILDDGLLGTDESMLFVLEEEQYDHIDLHVIFIWRNAAVSLKDLDEAYVLKEIK